MNTKENSAVIKKLRGLLRIIFGRTTLGALFLLIQLAVLFGGFYWMSEYLIYVYGASAVLSAVVLIYIISDEENSSIKLSWVVPILVFPVFGTLFYLFLTLQPGSRFINRRIQEVGRELEPYLKQEPAALAAYDAATVSGGNLVRYMNRYGKFPAYQETGASYFPLGDDMYETLLQELSKAERFIFMEYFIVERGIMWNSILEILEEKAKAGVEVRFMYDGTCSISLLPYSYPETLRAKGIQCKVFSPMRPTLSSYQNNRDHRKICVIDGHTAFTGGVNLADEYINRKERFGHWKDTAVMIKGRAVTSFTLMFLQLWKATSARGVSENFKNYLCPADYRVPAGMDCGGFVMPYADSPFDGENIGEQVYLDILGRSRQYVHIMTPYLILDDITLSALKYAAKRGVETIIIMPHIPDKIYAYLLARSYYAELLRAGVRIYEYTPGFVHAKMFTSDDEKAVVGTINLDYRSLYLHFECAAYFYKNTIVQEVEKDFQATLLKCEEITLDDCRRYPFLRRFAGKALRILAPLM